MTLTNLKPMTPRWVGLTGRAGSGKSFVADQIEKAGKHYRHKFAYALREEIESVLGVDDAPALWQKPTSPEVRWILQQYGTNYRRAQDPDYWVKQTLDAVKRDRDRWAKSFSAAFLENFVPTAPVFDDVRFPNEADAIRKEGGLLVRVLAPVEIRAERLGQIPDEHPTETAMDDYPVDMHITSTKENLAFGGQLTRILVNATYDDGLFVQAIQASLERD